GRGGGRSRLRRRLPAAALLTPVVWVDDGVLEQVARLVQGRHLAAAAEAGVDGQDAPIPQGPLQQQPAEVPREHGDRVRLGFFFQLPANLVLQARQQQPSQGVLGDRPQEGGVGRAI